MITYLVGLVIFWLPLIIYWLCLRDADMTKNIIWSVIIFFTSWIGLIVCFLLKKAT